MYDSGNLAHHGLNVIDDIRHYRSDEMKGLVVEYLMSVRNADLPS